MKKIALFICVFCFATSMQAQEKPLEFSEVIQEEGKTTQELYSVMRAWVAIHFKSANDVIQMDDKENGVLIGKGNFKYRAPGGFTYRYIDGHVDFILNIQVKDGRYKVSISDFTHKSECRDSWARDTWSFGLITDREKFKLKGMQDKRWLKTWPNLQEECKKFYEATIVSMKAATSGTVPIIDKDDKW